MRWYFAFVAISCALAMETAAQTAMGQEPVPAAAATQGAAKNDETPKPPNSGVQASPLETFMLRDSKGNLVPVLDIPFEEFERLLRLKRGLADPSPPPYSLDVLSIIGTARSDVVDLQVKATIRVRGPGAVRVPLSLGKAVLRRPAEFAGPGSGFLTFESADGYVAWLEGADGKPHEVTLQISVPVAQVAGQSRMKLAVPRATESSLRLTVSVPHADVQLISGEGLPTSTSQGEAQSELAILGPSGDLDLGWAKGRGLPVAGASALESQGEISVTIEGESRITSMARLRVRRHGGPLGVFRVRLPPGMSLVPSQQTGLSVAVISPTDNPVQPQRSAAQVVEVKLERPTTAVAEVTLLTERNDQAAPSPASSAISPASFEVLDAVRQRGSIEFVVNGDWQLVWKEDATVRRLELGTDAASARIAARFEYSRQPCEMGLSVSSRPSRVSIEPVHVVYVDERQVRLESTLRIRFRGARAAGISLELGDWKFDGLEPAELFDIDAGGAAAGQRQTIAFRTGTAIPSELELKVKAHLNFDPAKGELSLALPHAIGDVVTPATVMIIPADNVELSPQTARIAGLSLDPAPAVARLPNRQQPPLVYRDLGAGEPAQFTANVRVRTRWSTVSARAKVQLQQNQVQIEQRLDYRIAYERRRTFDLLIPRAVLLGGPIQVQLGDEPLTPVPVADAPQVGDAARFQVQTADDQIGLCQLLVKYSVPLANWDRHKSTALVIPLIVPADEQHQQFGGQQLEFGSLGSVRLEPDPVGIDEFSRPAPTSIGGQTVYAWSRATPISRWIVHSLETSAAPSTTLAKQWVQSWMGPHTRHERAAFRLTADGEHVRIKLPALPATDSVRAAVNGQAAITTLREPATLLVTLPPSVRGRECTVEVWYALDGGGGIGGLTTLQISPPEIEGASAPRRTFWQLGLPAHQHLLFAPPGVVAESSWPDLAWPKSPRSALGQEQLEDWVGASRQDPLPSSANVYLLGTIGPAPALRVTAIERRTMLGIGSFAALLFGLAWLHVGAIRRPESLLVIGVVLAGLALAFPEVSVLAAQAVALGAAVAFAATAWTWLASGSTPWAALAGAGAPPRESRSTETRRPPLDRLSGLTTATVGADGAAAESAP